MAAAAAGLFSQHLAQAQTSTGKTASPMAAAAGSASDDTAVISANDFLTLLVTEMQNQDPTADTDPNEYINQLVQVNSLEQLISINQTLSTALTAVSASPDASSVKSPINASVNGVADIGATPQVSSASQGAGTSAAIRQAPGNLSIPEGKPAAHAVAEALNGRHHST